MSDIDNLLREAHRSTPPTLSPAFDRNLSRRIGQSKPRRLSRAGWLMMSIYVLIAAVISVWGLSRIQWDFRWIPPAVVQPALWIAVPISFYVALSLPAWLRRRKAN
ncbi:MAG: hypothetical protein FJW20_04275 [Acidimicrobiia bacterium]|nr:hypothetical protein [Acidimicrobiia bacterium]